jgi:hypothetical protein
VQLSDVAATTELEPEPEAMTYAELWEAFDHIGATPVVAAEVMASALVAEGASSMAAKVHDACRAVLP